MRCTDRYQVARRAKILALNAVSEFKKGNFDGAMNAFIELNINPAKVVALYPEVISGRLQVPQERWIPLFGGPEPKPEVKFSKKEQADRKRSSPTARTPSPAGSVRSLRALRRGSLEIKAPGTSSSFDKDEDKLSLRGRTKEKSKTAGQ